MQRISECSAWMSGVRGWVRRMNESSTYVANIWKEMNKCDATYE